MSEVAKRRRKIRMLEGIFLNGAFYSPVQTTNFKCNRCGQCCKKRGDLLLIPMDIYYICKHLQISVKELMEEHVYEEESVFPKLYIKSKGDEERTCIFYDKHVGCKIYEVRPIACYRFPFYEYPVCSGEFWVEDIPCVQNQRKDTNGTGIEEIVQSSSKRYLPEKQLIERFVKMMNMACSKLENAKEKEKKAEWIKQKLFLDIDLNIPQEEVVSWMEKRVEEVEDALLFF